MGPQAQRVGLPGHQDRRIPRAATGPRSDGRADQPTPRPNRDLGSGYRPGRPVRPAIRRSQLLGRRSYGVTSRGACSRPSRPPGLVTANLHATERRADCCLSSQGAANDLRCVCAACSLQAKALAGDGTAWHNGASVGLHGSASAPGYRSGPDCSRFARCSGRMPEAVHLPRRRCACVDFAGGLVVHLNCGVAGLVAALVLGTRRGYGSENLAPFNLALAVIGTGMLWVGWFGFNGGSALGAGSRAAMAIVVTHLAACAGALAWMFLEWWTRGSPGARHDFRCHRRFGNDHARLRLRHAGTGPDHRRHRRRDLLLGPAPG